MKLHLPKYWQIFFDSLSFHFLAQIIRQRPLALIATYPKFKKKNSLEHFKTTHFFREIAQLP